MNKFVSAVVDDWQLNTVFMVHGGSPISMLDFAARHRIVPASAGLYRSPIQTPYKNFSGGCYIWFDSSTMANRTPGHFGNCGVDTERGPGIKEVDMGLSKTFPITERQAIEFRFEAIKCL